MDELTKSEQLAEIFVNEQLITQRKTIKGLIIALIISICLNALILGGVIYFASQYEITTEETTTTQEIEGDSAYIINDGQYNDNAVRNK